MADVLKSRSAWLEKRRKAALADTVVYSRGEVQIEVEASVGESSFDVTDEYGVVAQWESQDFIVAAEDLADLGQPEQGDRITETDGEATREYEVLAPAGRAPWRWHDAWNKVRRIHTKQVGES